MLIVQTHHKKKPTQLVAKVVYTKVHLLFLLQQHEDNELKICKYYDISNLVDNSENIVIKNIKEIKKKIERFEVLLSSHQTTIDNLYIDKVKGLVDEEMYKRIYEKIKSEITKINHELEILNKRLLANQNTKSDTGFNRCKSAVIDYMSLKNPTKDQIEGLVKKIEIDKDKKVYVYLKFPELVEI